VAHEAQTLGFVDQIAFLGSRPANNPTLNQALSIPEKWVDKMLLRPAWRGAILDAHQERMVS